MSEHLVDLYVIGGYLLLTIAVGFVMVRLNRNNSDYFKSGSRGTWWLVGTSNFMAGFTAWTFTGGAGVAFEAGPSVILMGLGGVLGTFFFTVPFLAKWFRQLRATTMPEVILARFGPVTQQAYAWINVLTRLLYSALHLYGFAIFACAIFGFNISWIIVIIGLTVLLYATFGGNIAVMSTDFLHGLVTVAMTVLLAVLCINYIGGFDKLFAMIQEKGLQQDYALIKSDGQFIGNSYTWLWVLAFTLYNFMALANVAASPQFFACKDGREARRAAIFVGIMGLLAQAIFYLPPIVARLTAESDVLAATFNKPVESAYAVMAMKLLPTGLMGVMVVAILAATMSTMDIGLNRNAAIISEDIYPTFCRLLKRTPLQGVARMRLGKVLTLILGLSIIILSLHFAGKGGEQEGIFGIMLDINATLTVPLMIPLFLCLFMRNVPHWTAIVTIFATLVPSLIGFFSKDLFGQEWSFQQKFFVTAPVGFVSFIACSFFWKRESVQYRQQVADFFKKMHTPVDFAKEVGHENDFTQLRIVGVFSIILGLFIGVLMFLQADWSGCLKVLVVSGSICLIGVLMVLAPIIQTRLRRSKMVPQSAEVTDAKASLTAEVTKE